MSFIFIGGCGHSGTTLLQKILSYHSTIENPLGILENSIKMFDKLSFEWQRAQIMFNETNKNKNKHKIRYLWKNPSNILHIKQIRKLYPNSKVILIHRDGRDVALSMNRRGKKGDFHGCCLYWKERSQLILDWKEKNKDWIYILGYHELINKPNETIQSLLHWLELDNENLIEKYHHGLNTNIKKPPNEKNGKNHNQLRKWQVNQPLYESSVWKEEMTIEQLDIWEKECRNISMKLGYI